MPQPSPPQGIPTQAEFGALRSFLAQHRPATVTAQEWNTQIAAVIGHNPGKTRAEITQALRQWMSQFLKATTEHSP